MKEAIYKKLAELLYSFLTGGGLVPVKWNKYCVYKSQTWNAPSAYRNINGVTFINNSQSGTIYINSFPLPAGQYMSFDTHWNEVDLTDYIIEVPDTVTVPEVVIHFKSREIKAA